jgi:hypothetical protein
VNNLSGELVFRSIGEDGDDDLRIRWQMDEESWVNDVCVNRIKVDIGCPWQFDEGLECLMLLPSLSAIDYVILIDLLILNGKFEVLRRVGVRFAKLLNCKWKFLILLCIDLLLSFLSSHQLIINVFIYKSNHFLFFPFLPITLNNDL